MARVLLVDDDHDILEALRGILEATYDVAVATNGAEALRMLLNGAYDAVVLDLMMPVMDGETFLRTLRAQGSKIPVIVASASANLARISIVSGANDYIAKPFEVSQLEKKLAALIGGSGAGGNLGGASGSSSGSGTRSGPMLQPGGYGSAHARARSETFWAVVSVESFSQ